MGWTSEYYNGSFFNFNKEEVVDFLLSEFSDCEFAMVHLERNINEQHEIYCIMQDRVRRKPFICVILVKIDEKERKIFWKEIPESMGPFYYNCPKEFFKFVPEVNKEWREKCIEKNVKFKRVSW